MGDVATRITEAVIRFVAEYGYAHPKTYLALLIAVKLFLSLRNRKVCTPSSP